MASSASQSIHPWDIRVAHEAPADGANALPGAIGATTLHGGRSRVRIGELLAELRIDDTPAFKRGATANAVFAPEDVRLIALDQPASDQEDP